MKRYGVVFICLSSRAIHLEIVHSLTSDSFIQALRRFICHRGNVQSIVSDNGTNLTAGSKELREAIKDWNNNVHDYLRQRDITWKYIPPSALHFGGVYEREIRSCRKVLSGLLNGQNIRLKDEDLQTLFCEFEAILNNRPLSELSSDPTSLECLTPNHL